MTYNTLRLARAIADAVLAADPQRRRDATRDPATQAVLEVLHRTGTWFIQEDVDADGVAIGGTAQRLEGPR